MFTGCYHFQSQSSVVANQFLITTKLTSSNNLQYTLCYSVALMVIILAQHKTFASPNSLYYSFISNNVNLTPSTYHMTCHAHTCCPCTTIFQSLSVLANSSLLIYFEVKLISACLTWDVNNLTYVATKLVKSLLKASQSIIHPRLLRFICFRQTE